MTDQTIAGLGVLGTTAVCIGALLGFVPEIAEKGWNFRRGTAVALTAVGTAVLFVNFAAPFIPN